jgi:hypothetical protein
MIQRYDLVAVVKGDPEDMMPSADGEWIRWADVRHLLPYRYQLPMSSSNALPESATLSTHPDPPTTTEE